MWYLMIWAGVTGPGLLIGWLRVFPKAGRPAWAALVPFYNAYVLVVGVARLSTLWYILIFVPVVQIIAQTREGRDQVGQLVAFVFERELFHRGQLRWLVLIGVRRRCRCPYIVSLKKNSGFLLWRVTV